MTRYIENLNAANTPLATGSYLWVVDASASASDKDRRLDVANFAKDNGSNGIVTWGGLTLTVPATGTAALLGTAQSFTARPTFQSGFGLGTAGKAFMYGNYASANISTTATLISLSNNRQVLVLVGGLYSTSGARFADLLLIMANAGIVTVLGSTAYSSPATRTYSLINLDLKLAMSANTYACNAIELATLLDA